MEQEQTPVVLIIFNRPETTEKVLSVIAQIRPQQLFIIADGPRLDRPGEKGNCTATRALIEGVDWDCEITKNYSDVNLGCRQRVATGLDWVFTLVPEAIILEDDCLPHPDFFRYCDELLARFRQDEKVMMIGGSNFQLGHHRSEDSYYFSRYFHVWGWATWRRAWQKYDGAMTDWPERRDNRWLQTCPWLNLRASKYWQRIFQLTYENQIDSWAYRWLYTGWKHDKLAITPQHNLVSNIGFGGNATHTKNQRNPLANIPAAPLTFPLQHPQMIELNIAADRFTQNKIYSPSQMDKLWRRMRFHTSRLQGKAVI